MAFHTEYLAIPGLVANSTGLASSQYLAVKLASTAGQVVAVGEDWMNSTTVTLVGVLQNAPAGGEAALVAVSGICKMKAGSTALVLGDAITNNSTGQAITSAKTDNAEMLGKVLEASSAAGDVVSVLLVPGGIRY